MKITVEELRKELNTICLLEFQENYNKSETARILSIEGESTKRARALEKRLNEELKSGYVLRVSNEGTILIMKEDELKDTTIENVKVYKEEKFITAPILKKIPYAYVMGSKVSKSVMERVVYALKGETNLE